MVEAVLVAAFRLLGAVLGTFEALGLFAARLAARLVSGFAAGLVALRLVSGFAAGLAAGLVALRLVSGFAARLVARLRLGLRAARPFVLRAAFLGLLTFVTIAVRFYDVVFAVFKRHV